MPSKGSNTIPDGDEVELREKIVCKSCGGDGRETCTNPDHGFIEGMVGIGDINRLGCPTCGHDPNYKVINGGSCEDCNGTGLLRIDEIMSLISDHTEAKMREAFMWEQYTGDYTKQYYDIKLWSGEVYENCWPNANTFHEGVIGKVIEGKDVCYIRARGVAQPPKEEQS